MKSKENLKSYLKSKISDKEIQVVRSKRRSVNKKNNDKKNIFIAFPEHRSKLTSKTYRTDKSKALEKKITKHKDNGSKESGSNVSNVDSYEESLIDYEYNRMFLVKKMHDDVLRLNNFRSFSDHRDHVTVMQEAVGPFYDTLDAAEDDQRRMSQSESNLSNDRRMGAFDKCSLRNQNRNMNVSCPRCSQVFQRERFRNSERNEDGCSCKCPSGRPKERYLEAGTRDSERYRDPDRYEDSRRRDSERYDDSRRRDSERYEDSRSRDYDRYDESRPRDQARRKSSIQKGTCKCKCEKYDNDDEAETRSKRFPGLPDTSCISTYHNKATNYSEFGNSNKTLESECTKRCKKCELDVNNCKCRKRMAEGAVYSVYSLSNKDVFGSKKCLKCEQHVSNCCCAVSSVDMTETEECCVSCGLNRDGCNTLKRTTTLPTNPKQCDCKQRILKKRLLKAVNICPKCRLPRDKCICLEEMILSFKKGGKVKRCICVATKEGEDSLDKLLQEAFNTCPKCGRKRDECICLEELLVDIKNTLKERQKEVATNDDDADCIEAFECKPSSCKRTSFRSSLDVLCSKCQLPKEMCTEVNENTLKEGDKNDHKEIKSEKKDLKEKKSEKKGKSKKVQSSNTSLSDSTNKRNVYHVEIGNSEMRMGGAKANESNNDIKKSTECPHCHKSESKCECKKPSTCCDKCKLPEIICECKNPVKSDPNYIDSQADKIPKEVKNHKKKGEEIFCVCSGNKLSEIRKRICEECLRPENNCVCKRETALLFCYRCGKRKAEERRQWYSDNKSRKGGSERARSTINRMNQHSCVIRRVENTFSHQPSQEFIGKSPEIKKNVPRHKNELGRSESREYRRYVQKHRKDNLNERTERTKSPHDSYPYRMCTEDLCPDCSHRSERSYSPKSERNSPTRAHKTKNCTVPSSVKSEKSCPSSPSTFRKLKDQFQRCKGCGKKHKKRSFESRTTQYGGDESNAEGCDKKTDMNEKVNTEDKKETSETVEQVADDRIESHNAVITKQPPEIVKVLLPPKKQHSNESVEEFGQKAKE